MKVIVFADDAIRQSIASTLNKEGVATAGAFDGIAMVNLLRREKFDVAIVDSLAEGVEVACCCINKLFDTPVLLLVRGERVDWKKLELMRPSGYLLEGTSGPEMVSRLWSVLRRVEDKDVNVKFGAAKHATS
jgi:DNA-binding response OmpR family regulator